MVNTQNAAVDIVMARAEEDLQIQNPEERHYQNMQHFMRDLVVANGKNGMSFAVMLGLQRPTNGSYYISDPTKSQMVMNITPQHADILLRDDNPLNLRTVGADQNSGIARMDKDVFLATISRLSKQDRMRDWSDPQQLAHWRDSIIQDVRSAGTPPHIADVVSDLFPHMTHREIFDTMTPFLIEKPSFKTFEKYLEKQTPFPDKIIDTLAGRAGISARADLMLLCSLPNGNPRLHKEFGDAFRRLIDTLATVENKDHISLRGLAEEVDVSQPHLSAMANGTRAPSLDIMRKIWPRFDEKCPVRNDERLVAARTNVLAQMTPYMRDMFHKSIHTVLKEADEALDRKEVVNIGLLIQDLLNAVDVNLEEADMTRRLRSRDVRMVSNWITAPWKSHELVGMATVTTPDKFLDEISKAMTGNKAGELRPEERDIFLKALERFHNEYKGISAAKKEELRTQHSQTMREEGRITKRSRYKWRKRRYWVERCITGEKY